MNEDYGFVALMTMLLTILVVCIVMFIYTIGQDSNSSDFLLLAKDRFTCEIKYK